METLVKPQDKVLLEKIAGSLKAIAHPIRLSILKLLENGNRMNVTQIYQTLNLEQAVASQHLSILKEKGILQSKREGKNSYYFIRTPEILKIVDLILQTLD